MQATQMNREPVTEGTHDRYATCIKVSKRIRWDIDEDVIRGRVFDVRDHFLPAGLTLVDRMTSLSEDEKRLMSQVQGRTYANVFGLVERFIGAKILEMSGRHWLGDQVALEALVRFSDEELKHQELFRRIDAMVGDVMPEGYRFPAEPNEVARAVLGARTWAVLALTCDIELFTQAHYKQSIDPESRISPLYKDVFLYHWREESQHAILDELEWKAEDARIDDAERDAAVDDFIMLVGAVDGILQQQAAVDTEYFAAMVADLRGHTMSETEQAGVEAEVLRAYRWQYIVSGAQHPRFAEILGGMVNEAQMARIGAALAPVMEGL